MVHGISWVAGLGVYTFRSHLRLHQDESARILQAHASQGTSPLVLEEEPEQLSGFSCQQPVPAPPMTSLLVAVFHRQEQRGRACHEWSAGLRCTESRGPGHVVLLRSFLDGKIREMMELKPQEAALACSAGVPSLPAHPKCLFPSGK